MKRCDDCKTIMSHLDQLYRIKVLYTGKFKMICPDCYRLTTIELDKQTYPSGSIWRGLFVHTWAQLHEAMMSCQLQSDARSLSRFLVAKGKNSKYGLHPGEESIKEQYRKVMKDHNLFPLITYELMFEMNDPWTFLNTSTDDLSEEMLKNANWDSKQKIEHTLKKQVEAMQQAKPLSKLEKAILQQGGFDPEPDFIGGPPLGAKPMKKVQKLPVKAKKPVSAMKAVAMTSGDDLLKLLADSVDQAAEAKKKNPTLWEHHAKLIEEMKSAPKKVLVDGQWFDASELKKAAQKIKEEKADGDVQRGDPNVKRIVDL